MFLPQHGAKRNAGGRLALSEASPVRTTNLLVEASKRLSCTHTAIHPAKSERRTVNSGLSMTEKRKVLGRGLDTLLPSRAATQPPTHVGPVAVAPAQAAGEAVRNIPIDLIDRNPY